MDITPTMPTIILDPYLLVNLSGAVASGALASCESARFAVCDHLPPEDFHPAEYAWIIAATTSRNVGLLPVMATEMVDLLYMRDALALHQIASIAAARSHRHLFASGCGIVRRMAGAVLETKRVLCGRDVRGFLGQTTVQS